MSKNAAMDFVNELHTNVELYDRSLEISGIDEMVELARKNGYDVTAEDLAEAETHARKLLSDESDSAAEMVEMSLEELDNVAGGAFFFGEDATDGHEMGCLLAWHHGLYEEDCVSTYYCTTDNYFSPGCHGPHNDK